MGKRFTWSAAKRLASPSPKNITARLSMWCRLFLHKFIQSFWFWFLLLMSYYVCSSVDFDIRLFLICSKSLAIHRFWKGILTQNQQTIHTHTHTYTPIHVRTHIYIQKHIHPHICNYKQTNKQTHGIKTKDIFDVHFIFTLTRRRRCQKIFIQW